MGPCPFVPRGMKMICKHCGAELESYDDLLVDVVSGDDGGTYDYCPDNPRGDEDERLHEVGA